MDNQKIKQINPGVDYELFVPDQSIDRENIFLSIGRIQQQKGQLETLRFLNSFKEVETDFMCYFVGGPSGSSVDEYLSGIEHRSQYVVLYFPQLHGYSLIPTSPLLHSATEDKTRLQLLLELLLVSSF